LLEDGRMTTTPAGAVELKPKKLRYSAMLRCLGQCFEEMELKALEVRTHGDDVIVQGWHRGTSIAMDFEKHYSLDDLHRLDEDGKRKRRSSGRRPDLLSLSQMLRLAGNYVEGTGGRLLRVCWQDQSDRIQSVTIQWEPIQAASRPADPQPTLVEELCIHIYKQRKKIHLVSERQASRPFVNVARGG
jgi:hypothetical protein